MHIKVTSGGQIEYPYSIGKLRRDNPNTSFPKRIPDEMLAEWGVYPVKYKPQPDYDDRTQRIEQDAQPVMEDGKWVIGWSVVDKTAEEVQQYDATAAKFVRDERDLKLKECDWVAVKAVDQNAQDSLGIQIPVVWVSYRQALRDITAQAGFPHNVIWPVKPT